MPNHPRAWSVIGGTRVPTDLVIGKLAGGMAMGEEVMAEHDLEKEDILAALDYAAKLVAQEEVRATR